ncbi:hypothetical protein V8J88_12075 [Massilia sp. W12]|uniref:hypothetical protein n=1 Tax=Massilia sp. W12 TaxID=3126507 RepID=UPI0030CA79DF
MIVNLADCLEVRCGVTMRSRIITHPQGNVCLVRMQDMHDENAWQALPCVLAKNMPHANLLDPACDLVLRGRGQRLTMRCVPQLTMPTVCVSPLMRVRVRDPARLLPQYLCWYVNTPQAQAQLQHQAYQSDIAQLRVHALDALCMPLPAPERQAMILTAAAQARSDCAAAQAKAWQTYEQMIQDLLEEAGQ